MKKKIDRNHLTVRDYTNLMVAVDSRIMEMYASPSPGAERFLKYLEGLRKKIGRLGSLEVKRSELKVSPRRSRSSRKPL